MPDTYFEMNVFWSEADGGYVAVAPQIPGHASFGKTWPEALTEFQKAAHDGIWPSASNPAGTKTASVVTPVG
jgi:hypothetical protein